MFSPARTVISCSYNFPGSFLDSTVDECGDIYDKFEYFYRRYVVKFVVESAFCRTMYSFLGKLIQYEVNAEGSMEFIRIFPATSL